MQALPGVAVCVCVCVCVECEASPSTNVLLEIQIGTNIEINFINEALTNQAYMDNYWVE